MSKKTAMNRPLTQEEFVQVFHEQWQKVRVQLALLDSLMMRAEILYGIGGKPQPPFYGQGIVDSLGFENPDEDGGPEPDDPEAPYEVSQHTDVLWIVRPKLFLDHYVKWRFEGTETECIAVRDALNGLDHET